MLHFVYNADTTALSVYHESACMGIPAIFLLYLLIAVHLTSALEIQALALLQLYAVFYAVLSLSITGYIPAPEYPEMYDSAVSCLFSNPSIV